jgi:multicomponent Na+:H+ antiporter subunit G
MSALEIIGGIVSIGGSVLLFLASLGLIRMPDVYNRMQAGTKATTLGSMLFLVGIAIMHPQWWSKILLLILFIVFTNPISSHALARAAHFVGVPMSKRSVNDALADANAAASAGAQNGDTTVPEEEAP